MESWSLFELFFFYYYYLRNWRHTTVTMYTIKKPLHQQQEIRQASQGKNIYIYFLNNKKDPLKFHRWHQSLPLFLPPEASADIMLKTTSASFGGGI